MTPDGRPVLVTGASGYLGRHVMDLALQRGQSVVGVSRSGYHACDLTDIRKVKALLDTVDPSVIVHCAAEVPKGAAAYADVAAARKSTEMCATLSEVAGCPVVFASSMTVYGNAPPIPVTEDFSDPETPYAAGKLAGERYFSRCRYGSFSLRLPGLFGPPRAGGLLYKAATAFIRKLPFTVATPCPVWAAMHVRDAADYVLRAVEMTNDDGSYAYNIGYPGKFSIASGVKMLAGVCGATWEDELGAPEFAMDLSRTHRDLGYLEFTFEDRLKELVNGIMCEASAKEGMDDVG